MSRGRFLQLLRLAVLIAAAWTFLGFFFASQAHAVSTTRGEKEEIHERTIETTVAMIVWALLTPPIIWVAERLPIEKPHAVRRRSSTSSAAISSCRNWRFGPRLQTRIDVDDPEANLAGARLRQLRRDLQPHFLFNTLNDVAALASGRNSPPRRWR